jgi:hypothetical protein
MSIAYLLLRVKKNSAGGFRQGKMKNVLVGELVNEKDQRL